MTLRTKKCSKVNGGLHIGVWQLLKREFDIAADRCAAFFEAPLLACLMYGAAAVMVVKPIPAICRPISRATRNRDDLLNRASEYVIQADEVKGTESMMNSLKNFPGEL